MPTYRSGTGRNGFTMDSWSNIHIRVTVFKNPLMVKLDDKFNADPDTSVKAEDKYVDGVKFVLDQLTKKLYGNFFDVFTETKNDKASLEKIVYYYDNTDILFSILFGLRYNDKKTKISDLRYAAAKSCFQLNFCIISCNNRETQMAVGQFDANHCENGPLVDMNKDQAIFVCTGERNETIKKEEKGKFAKNAKVNKLVQQEIILDEEEDPINGDSSANDPKDDENSAEPSPIQKPNQPKKTKGGGES